MPEFLFAPVPHQQAIDFIKSKPIVSREVFDGLLPELRARAFVITGIEAPANVLQNVRDIIADLPAGFTWGKVKDQIVDAISPWMIDESADAEVQAAQLAGAEAKAELLLRVHGQEAYQAAAFDVMTRQKNFFKYWQYQTMGDSKVRPAHAALEGLVLPADSPFWQTHFPPWDWGCRCIAIPISDAGLEHIAKKDTDQIVTGARLHNLENNNVIERFDKQTGTRKFIDVAPPEGPTAFKWDPGSLKLDLAQLKERYNADVWSTFEKWAKKTEIRKDFTVWDWLEEGGEGEGSSAVPPEPTPPILPAPAASATPPVSDAITLRMRNVAFKKDMQNVLNTIDSAHNDGELPDLDLKTSRRQKSLGVLDIDAKAIEVRADGDWRQLTAAHEIGHALDWWAIETPGKFASEDLGSALMKPWRNAIENSESFALLKSSRSIPNRGYFMSERELFARSYAQYIAWKTKDQALVADVDKILGGVNSFRQWTWKDFEPIGEALDDLFDELGWSL